MGPATNLARHGAIGALHEADLDVLLLQRHRERECRLDDDEIGMRRRRLNQSICYRIRKLYPVGEAVRVRVVDEHRLRLVEAIEAQLTIDTTVLRSMLPYTSRSGEKRILAQHGQGKSTSM